MTPRLWIFSKSDRYLLGRMFPRMAAALIVTLVILLMERVLRLLDIVTTQGAPLNLVVSMALNLVPHYLGLALPATFCLAILTALAALSRENEIDALENTGWSLRRIGVPFVITGVILAMVSLPLFGFLQPYSRYGYRAIKHAAYNAGWSGRLEESVFVNAGNGLLISAGEVDPTGRVLSRVFVIQREDNGESVFTAERGLILPDPDARVVRLLLKNGRGLVAGGWLDFDDLKLAREFAIDRNPFRPRGGEERELTFGELLNKAEGADGFPPDPSYLAEFHGRLVRIFSLIAVAFLSVPLGVARKRAPVWPRAVLAVAILIGYDKVIQALQAQAALGVVDPVLSLWGSFGVFTIGCAWLYAMTPGQGSASPLRVFLRQVDVISADIAQLGRRFGIWLGVRS